MISKIQDEQIVACEYCGNIYKWDNEDDLDFIEYGLAILKEKCSCGHQVVVDYERDLTKDNFLYPKHFAETNSKNSVILSDEGVQSIIYNEILKFEIDDDLDFKYIQSGDKFIFFHREKDQLFVLVANNTKETYIDLE